MPKGFGDVPICLTCQTGPTLHMSHRLPKELVNQFCEDTPFTGQEIQRLWRRFQALDRTGGGEGTLTLAVTL